MASVFNQVNIYLRRSWDIQHQYEVHASVARVPIDALDYEYNHDARAQSPRLSADRLCKVAGRRGLGPRDQDEHTARVFRGYLSCESMQQAAVSHRAGLGCLVEKTAT